MSGYVDCACRDCFAGPIMGEADTMCDACEEAGCEPDSECRVDRCECGALMSDGVDDHSDDCEAAAEYRGR